MRKTNWIDSISLKKKFTAIFILIAVIPVLVTTTLIVGYIELDNKAKLEIDKKFENQVKFTVTLALRAISTDATFFSQSNSFLDFLMVPAKLRVYAENRLFGMAHEVSSKSQLKTSFLILDSDKRVIFEFVQGNSKKLEFKENEILVPGYKLDQNFEYVIFTSEIRYDDQLLQGPTARLRGYLITYGSVSDLKKSVPELKKILLVDSTLDVEKLHIEIHKTNQKNQFSVAFFIVISGGLLVVAILTGVYFVNKSILSPISRVTGFITSQNISNPQKSPENEIEVLELAILSYQENIKKKQEEIVNQSKLSILVSIASQVAHDIRSPLTALNMVIGTLDKMPEDKRIIIRTAIQRINDIANELLARGKNAREGIRIETNGILSATIEENHFVMLSSLVDSLVSEKRTQFRDKINVFLDLDLSKSYGLFVKVPPNEFKRVLSNLINNSVEAFENESGRIFVTFSEEIEGIKLQIMDNGRGIPSDIVDKLGEKGFSYGKSAGSGLGLHHGKSTVEAVGGKLVIESDFIVQNFAEKKFEPSTIITIVLPKISPPKWFVEKLVLPLNSKLAVLDDDHSIHNVWQGRILSINSRENKIQLVSFTSTEIFKKWVKENFDQNVVYLIDYELIGQRVSGLDTIEELGISVNSILVTSRYDEVSILERCNRLGVTFDSKGYGGIGTD